MRPVFIVLEGIDGTGKTTAASAIKEHLESKGHKVMVTAEPTKGMIGKMVAETDDLSPETEALLFTADRACHTKEISDLISNGTSVISDRYYVSTLAYQSAAGMDEDWLRALNSKIIREPDVTLILDMDPELSLKRVDSRGEKSRFEKLEYQRKVRDAYLRIAEEKDYPIIDASASKEKVAASIINEIDRRL